MDEFRVIVDTDKINRLLNDLRMTDKEARQAVRRGLSQSVSLIRKKAQSNLSQVGSRTKNLNKFIRVGLYKKSDGANITILPDRRRKTETRLAKKGLYNKSFLLRFFESGTDERNVTHRRGRKMKKTANRGYIKASKFFSNAVSSKKAEAEKTLEEFIVKNIQKVANRRK